MLVLQVAAAISAFAMQGQVHDMLATTMKETMMEYEKDDYMKETVDFLQSSVSIVISLVLFLDQVLYKKFQYKTVGMLWH